MNKEKVLNPENCSLKVNEIKDNVLRLDFYSQSYLGELKQSIEKEGLLEPLLVHKSEESKAYILLNGHYRIRVLRQLKYKEATCNVIVCDEEQAVTNYIASFIRKNGLSALEEGHILSKLVRKGYQLKEIGRKWNKSESWVSRRIKLLTDLDETVKQALKNGHIFPRIAQEITRLPQGKEQKRVFVLVKKHGLTKDETSSLVDRWLEANQEQKLKIEEEFLKVSTPQKVESPMELIKYKLLKCTQSIQSLVSNLSQCKTLEKEWPWEEYFCFFDLVKGLNERLEQERFTESEGQQ